MGKLRMTQTTVKVLVSLLNRKQEKIDGIFGTGLKSGSLYPILARLEECGWVKSDWAPPDETSPQRPRRRYYHLTKDGEKQAWQVVKDLQEDFVPLLSQLQQKIGLSS